MLKLTTENELLAEEASATIPKYDTAKELKIFLLETQVLSSVNTLNLFITFTNCNLLDSHQYQSKQIFRKKTDNAEPNIV